jgi:hypothetical protein
MSTTLSNDTRPAQSDTQQGNAQAAPEPRCRGRFRLSRRPSRRELEERVEMLEYLSARLYRDVDGLAAAIEVLVRAGSAR